MTPIDLLGWSAAAMTLLTFLSRDMRLLRVAGMGANLAFIGYAAATHLWPVLALHLVLLPINVWRLLQLLQRCQMGGVHCECLDVSPGQPGSRRPLRVVAVRGVQQDRSPMPGHPRMDRATGERP